MFGANAPKKSLKTGQKTAKINNLKTLFLHTKIPRNLHGCGVSFMVIQEGFEPPDPRLRRPNINSSENPYFMRFAGFKNPFGANAGANAVRVHMPC